MNIRLNALFEEDVRMMDAIEDMELATDTSSDNIIIGFERAEEEKDTSSHLFANDEDEPLDDYGLTAKEQHEYDLAVLAGEDEDFDDIDDDGVDILINREYGKE